MKEWLFGTAVLLSVILLFTFVPAPQDENLPRRLLGAIAEGRLIEIQEYLDLGVNPNARISTRGGLAYTTPLTVAAATGKAEVARLLLSAGADPNLEDFERWTPLMHAGWRGRPDIARILLQAGADPNTADSLGTTPLMLAAQSGCCETLQVLLGSGADPSLRSLAGHRTAEVFAAELGRTDALDLLRRASMKLVAR